MKKKTLIHNIIKQNGSFVIKAAENILNGLLGLKYSYMQLDLMRVSKYDLLLVLSENIQIVGTMLKIRKMLMSL